MKYSSVEWDKVRKSKVKDQPKITILCTLSICDDMPGAPSGDFEQYSCT